MDTQGSLVGVMERFTDAPREVRVCGGDHQGCALLFVSHDAGQGVLRLLLGFCIVDHPHDLFFVISEKRTAQSQETLRVLVTNSETSRADDLIGSRRPRVPGPATVMKQGSALGADRRLSKLAPQFIGVVLVLLNCSVSAISQS
jgi:hypothetical protein